MFIITDFQRIILSQKKKKLHEIVSKKGEREKEYILFMSLLSVRYNDQSFWGGNTIYAQR